MQSELIELQFMYSTYDERKIPNKIWLLKYLKYFLFIIIIFPIKIIILIINFVNSENVMNGYIL